jgi:hypothetical protein
LLDAGFREVEIRSVTKPFPVASIPECWESMVKDSAPILMPMLKKSMGENAWREKEIFALEHLEEKLPSTPTALTSDTWLGLGVKRRCVILGKVLGGILGVGK